MLHNANSRNKKGDCMTKLLVACALISAANADYHMLGLNEEGKKLSAKISSDDYKSFLKNSLQAVDSKLANLKDAQVSNESWKLTYISIGLGAKFDIGFSSFKLGSGIRQRYIYRRQ